MSLTERDEWSLNQSDNSDSFVESRREQVTAHEYTVEKYSAMSFSSYNNGVSTTTSDFRDTRTSSFGSSNQNAGNFNFKSSAYIAKDEKHWVEIQKNTFTNWVNEHLREYGEEVTDLSTAFEDGLKLIHLVEAVSTKRVRRYNKKPRMYAQKLENVTAALNVVEEDGIHLVNIGMARPGFNGRPLKTWNEDIVNGNMKLILGLIWRLILHYQISSGGSTSGKQLLLIWLRNALPDLEIKNLTNDWNNGIALNGLVDFCKPGLMPDYKRLNPDERLSNVTKAMTQAEQRLRIPKLLSPEFFVNPYVDELSMMTYLSQFTKPGSPGEARTMEIVNETLPKGQNVSNFNEDWVDGKALCHFVESQAPGTIPNYDRISDLSAYERARLALENAEEKLGIKKIITPEEVVDNVDELPLMAYLLQFRNAPSLQSQAHLFTAEGNGLRRATQGKTADFNVHGRKGIGFDNLKVEITGPFSDQRVNVEKRLMGDGSMRYMYTAVESGTHTVSIKHVGKHIPNSPFTIQANEDVGDITVSGSGLKFANVMRSADFTVDSNRHTSAPITAMAEGPTRTVPVVMDKLHNGSYKAKFVPTEVGEHRINVMVGSRILPGCPFICKVGDPSKCVLRTQESTSSSSPGKEVRYTVDTSEAGLGELAVSCTGPEGNIPVNVGNDNRGHYDVTFTPRQTGDYRAKVTFNGDNIPSSPYNFYVADPSKIVAHGKGLYNICTRDKSEFFITLKGAGQGNLEVRGDGPHGRFPVEVRQSPDDPDKYIASYTLFDAGDYKIHVSYAGNPIPGSPFFVKVADPSKVRINSTDPNFLGKKFPVRREIEVPVQVPRTAGEGELQASVTGPDLDTVPSNVIKGIGDKYFIRFVPRKHGSYKINVTYGGKEVQNSPFKLGVTDPTSVRVKLRELESTSEGFFVKKKIDIPIDVPDETTDISCSVKGPDGERVESKLSRESDKLYHVGFTPYRQGKYTVDVLCSGESVENSPFVITVMDEPRVQLNLQTQLRSEPSLQSQAHLFTAEGNGLRRAIQGKTTDFNVHGRENIGFDNVTVDITGPLSDQRVNVEKRLMRDGSMRYMYTPVESGTHTVSIKHVGKHIPNSPFTIQANEDVTDITVSGSGLKCANVMRSADFIVDPKRHYSAPITAMAEGPTRTVPVSMDKLHNGSYKAKFVPTEAGEHRINVMVGSRILPGCPFICKVGDPSKCVLRTQESTSSPSPGKEVRYTVDTSEAGLGELAVNCTGPEGSIPVNVRSDNRGHYDVTFTPRQTGDYRANVTFNGDKIPSSPYNFSVADSSKIVAHGKSLYNICTRDKSEFFITLKGAGQGKLDVRGDGPHGRFPVEMRQSPNDPDKYIMSYTLFDAGDYKIHVNYAGNPIPGSPFLIKVADPSKVRINSTDPIFLGKKFPVRREIEVPIQVPRTAGEGELQASVTGPDLDTVPSNVIKGIGDKYFIRFVPRKHGSHKINVTYGGKEVQNSPFKLGVTDPTSVRVKLRELESTSEGFFVKKKVDIPIDAPDETTDISCSVKGPDGERVESRLSRESDKLYHVGFTPYRQGKYTVDVLCSGESVENSPFVITVMDEPEVQLNLKEFQKQASTKYRVRHELDVPMEIPDQVGEVTAKVTDPDQRYVSSTFRREGDGLHHLRFTPYKPGPYKVDILCRGKSVEGCPFTMSVVDPASTLVRMRQPTQAPETSYLVRRELDIALDCPDEDFELSCSVEGPDDEFVQSFMVKEGDGLHHVKFVPYRPGIYKVHVRYGGEAVESSPFHIRVGDPENKIRVAHAQGAQEAQTEKVIKSEVDLALETPFQIDQRDVTASVLGPGDEKIASQLEKDKEGKYHVKFVPIRPGQYRIFVRYGGELVEGAPYVVNVGLPAHVRCLVAINEHDEQKYFTSHELDFPFEVPDGSNGSLTAKVTGPDNNRVDELVTKDRVHSSTYHIRFIPRHPGRYRMDVFYSNIPVKDSPFYIMVRDQIQTPGAKQCEAKGRGLTGGIINERCEFKVNTRRAGPGRLEASLSCKKYNANVDVEHVSDDTYVCYYITPVAGLYDLTVKYDGVHIPGSPFKALIQDLGDASRCMVEGAAIAQGAGVFVGQPMAISISSRDAGPGQLHVRCEGPTRDCDVTVFDNKDSTYHVQILPTEVGNHLVFVEWGGSSVNGSPFLVRVGHAPDPTKVTAVGSGLENGLLKSFKGNFLVDTKGAGPGTLKVRIHGPRGAFKVEMYRDTTKDRSIGVRYNPTETGRYIINIKWADQHIPGSPFDVTIVNTKEELDSLNELKDNVVTQHNGLHHSDRL